MSDKTGIEWTQSDDGTPGATWNPVTGCSKVSAGCDHCLAPETRVLRADMTWVPIADIQVGDKLVSFTESPAVGANRVWEETTVEAKWEVEKPTIEVELANGARFTASEDHRWLIANRSASSWWRQTIGLNFKTSVRAIRCEPADTECHDYMEGYVAGVTAGDGTFRWDPAWRSDKLGDPQSYWRVAKPERDRAALDRLVRFLGDMGIAIEVRPFDQGPSAFTEAPLPMMKVETRRLSNMPRIARMCEEREDRDWMAGWLAGLFDTDASYSGGSLRFCQSKPNDVLVCAQRYAKELGFTVELEHFEGSECPTARLMGGIAANIAFLAAISPALARRCRDFYGKRLETPAQPVIGVRRGPVRRLVDITTSTRTFIAEGALTHNCYAETFAERWRGVPGHHFERGFDVTLRPERLDQPHRWARPRRIFVNSMSDLFHKDVPDEYIARVWQVMASTPRHTYLILTKRHARMRAWVNRCAVSPGGWITHDGTDPAGACDGTGVIVGYPEPPERLRRPATGPRGGKPRFKPSPPAYGWPLPNVWLGVSVEDPHWADVRIPALLGTPAAVRFISAEPLLGPVTLFPGKWIPPLGGGPRVNLSRPWEAPGPTLDWVIVGGESGPGARRMAEGWARNLVNECTESGTPVFVKQLGSVLGKELGAGPKGGDMDCWPEDLRVREFPRTVGAVTA